MASGVGDGDAPAEALASVSGASVRPPAPAQLGWARDSDGGARVRWVRRSRGGWRWLDGVDAPLAEEAELYRASVTLADGSVRVAELVSAGLLVGAAERALGTVTVSVRQIGTFGESPPATISIAGEER